MSPLQSTPHDEKSDGQTYILHFMAREEINYGICLKRTNEFPELFLVFHSTPVDLNYCMYVTGIC